MQKSKFWCRFATFNYKNKSGFTIIEALTLLFIFTLIVVTFYSIFTAGTRYIIESKNRLGALSLANEKMEIIRNLAYDNIGTIGGEISGNIPQDENVTENTRTYGVHTQVEYVDDPFDGLGYSDTIWFEDYKKVTVTVSWNGAGGASEVELVSRFVPHGVEKQNPNDGILSINIYSKEPGAAQSDPVSGATVHVSNSDIGLDTGKETDEDGNVTFMGSNIRYSIQKYEITVTKSDYETVTTLPPYPATSYNPTDVHASVVLGSPNTTNILQNKLADLKISSIDHLNQPIGNIDFHIKGGRKMGTTIGSNDPVYNLDEDSRTGSNGEKDYTSASPGSFEITPDLDGTNYELIRTDPVSPCTLLSDPMLNFKIELADKNVTSLLLTVEDGNGLPVPNVQAELKNETLNYDVTLSAADGGKIFFPDSADPLQAETYNLKVTTDGYSEDNSQVIIEDGKLKMQTINLTATP